MFGAVEKPWWDDDPVFIIGGGPSLAHFDFGVLNGYKLGINDSAFYAKADALFSLDPAWITRRRPEIMAFKGPKFFAVPPNYSFDREWLPNVTYLLHSNGAALTTEPTEINGSNSGYGALNFAFLKKAKSMTLLGFDMGGSGAMHWHPEYDWYDKGVQYSNYTVWAKEFEAAQKQLVKAGVTVLNASPDSAIECFQKISLDTLKYWDMEE
jgi:hypothetical protein